MDLISITRTNGTAFTFNVRGHEVISDMSEQDGGADAGPAPAELLAGSLGTCIGMLVQFYCNRQGYEGDVEASMTLELADNPKRVGRIVIDLELPESVPEHKKEAIRRVAEKCPVHETLLNPPEIDIEIV